jgi:hypothetical protein
MAGQRSGAWEHELDTDMLPMSVIERRQPNSKSMSGRIQTYNLRKPSGDGRSLTSKNETSAFHSSISSNREVYSHPHPLAS